MKSFLTSVLLSLTLSAYGQTSSSNAASSGSMTSEGVSEGPLGPNKEEAKTVRKRASSMGGAPNVGAGMATGTGAGSTVGNEVGAKSKVIVPKPNVSLKKNRQEVLPSETGPSGIEAQEAVKTNSLEMSKKEQIKKQQGH